MVSITRLKGPMPGPGLSRHKLSVWPDYHQFYIQDAEAETDLSPWTLGIATARNTLVTVVMEKYAQEPPDDRTEWDHVVEASLEVPSGRVVIAGCPGHSPDARRFAVTPGWNRVRVSHGPEGDDRYRLQLWPAPPAEIRILKQRSDQATL